MARKKPIKTAARTYFHVPRKRLPGIGSIAHHLGDVGGKAHRLALWQNAVGAFRFSYQYEKKFFILNLFLLHFC
ncbi:hypothetical protein I656_03444 [Geobacillus sp. WSUCF1]|nr:hypothetical protein I656_03444 [Geobacillus sp. WSUCF1]